MTRKFAIARLTLAMLATCVFATAAQAMPITFNLGTPQLDETLTELEVTQDGITLLLDNWGPAPQNVQDPDGLCFLGAPPPGGFCPEVNSLDMTFSEGVRLLSYVVGFLSVDNELAELSFAQNGQTSLESNFVDEALSAFNNPFAVAGGQALNVNGAIAANSFGSLQIRQITVERFSAVPLPATGALLLLGLAVLRLRRA